jgi:hypothetical protein
VQKQGECMKNSVFSMLPGTFQVKERETSVNKIFWLQIR